VSLERRDNSRPRNFQPTIALAEVSFVLARLLESRTHKITGTAPNQEPRRRLGVGMKRLQYLLVQGAAEVRKRSLRQHGPHLAQRERACEVEEIAHLVRSQELRV
jgi:hypothetical protein